MRMNALQQVTFWFYIALAAFWAVLFMTSTTAGLYNYLFSFLFGLTPLFGGAVALRRANLWGGLGSAIGKAVFFGGLGIFLWGVGELIWSYYNFILAIPAPYPSLADLGFAPSIFFYGLGAMYLAKATGAKYALRDHAWAKPLAFIGPFLIAALSYYFLIVVARGGVVIPEGETALKAFLDVVYPLGDFVGLTIAAVVSGLSFKYLGGKYKADIYALLLGLAVMYIADTVFSYTTTVGTYYNADFGDFILTTGTTLLTLGILGFCQQRVDE